MSTTSPPRHSRPRKLERRLPDLDTVYTINPDGSRNFLHPADVRGRFQRRKNLVFAALLVIYAVVPWIQVGGHPLVSIDLPGRAAYLAGHTFTNNDFHLLFFLVSGLGFALFVVTSLWGRIWCGYACPQTVFLEGVYRKIERRIEGPRDTRIKRNLGPWTWDKSWRKGVKHAVFVALAFANAHIFVAYFVPPKELLAWLGGSPAEHWTTFLWVVIWTAILYFDYAWFREQVCLIVCPYGRAQSALVDADTMIIGYDSGRGEPRSRRAEEGGDCIDCFRCVAVCPTGIDIRNGLQMECVGCANCVDACDEIMDKVGLPKGLIRYDSKGGFDSEGRRKLIRPRTIAYVAAALAGLAAFGFTLAKRSSFEVHVLRVRGMPYVLEEDEIRNVYNFRIQNKGESSAVYFVEAESTGDARPELVLATPRLAVESLADVTTSMIARLPRGSYAGTFPLTITVADSASGERRSAEVTFRGP
ncbi:MAG: cytochrome c oxidase accessory protein CcoG [Candidatus Eiseniibacteriota bacterium]